MQYVLKSVGYFGSMPITTDGYPRLLDYTSDTIKDKNCLAQRAHLVFFSIPQLLVEIVSAALYLIKEISMNISRSFIALDWTFSAKISQHLYALLFLVRFAAGFPIITISAMIAPMDTVMRLRGSVPTTPKEQEQKDYERVLEERDQLRRQLRQTQEDHVHLMQQREREANTLQEALEAIRTQLETNYAHLATAPPIKVDGSFLIPQTLLAQLLTDDHKRALVDRVLLQREWYKTIRAQQKTLEENTRLQDQRLTKDREATPAAAAAGVPLSGDSP